MADGKKLATKVRSVMNDNFDGFLEDGGDVSAVDFDKDDLTLDGSYNDLDLSSIVPAKANFVILRVQAKEDAGNKAIAFRKNGNSNTINVAKMTTQVANVEISNDLIVAIDSNRKIEYNGASATWATLNITVAGWIA